MYGISRLSVKGAVVCNSNHGTSLIDDMFHKTSPNLVKIVLVKVTSCSPLSGILLICIHSCLTAVSKYSINFNVGYLSSGNSVFTLGRL
jgi:hypothetical protein